MSIQILSCFILLFAPLVHFVAETDGANIESKQIEEESLLQTKFTETLDHSGRIILSWELEVDKSVITFELWAQTVGYVGFGISPNGGMAGADIFIAGVAPDGAPYSSDRFASANQLPKIDSHQDWTLLEAKENETTTYLKFSRLVDTCDKDEDYPISKGTNKVIWAIGPTDQLVKHSMGDRGTRSISLLQKRPKFNETGLNTWIPGLKEFRMPSDETTYWCTFHSFPLEGPNYLVAYDAHLPDENAIKHVHHMVLYKCLLPGDGSLYTIIESLTLENGYRGYHCPGSGIDNNRTLIYNACHMQTLVPFPKGNELTALPNNVALKFANEPNHKLYFMLVTHLDNPEKSEGVLLNSGLKMFFTNKPRQYGASMFDVTYEPRGILIPPNTQSFVYSGHCSPACTNKLDSSGIFLFNVQLHAHTFGTKLKLRHFRNDIELPWIAYEDNFDFNYQQFRLLDEERKVLPGDRLVIECEYDSTRNNGKVVVGGRSSNNEMCQAMIWYYPRNDNFFGCWSYPDEKEAIAPFNITKYTYPDKHSISTINIEEPPSLRGRLEESLNTKFNWTNEFIEQFQQRKRSQDQIVACALAGLEIHEELERNDLSHPKNIAQYVPKETCS